ncbi:MAG: glycosyltransferase [Terriglobales bacterium]
MRSAAQVGFWASVAWLGYLYVGYPALVWLLGKLSRRQYRKSADYMPSVSVLISARNEEQHLRRKINETLAWNYPPDKLEIVVASDASEDGTDEILAELAGPRVRWVRMPVRTGKNLALNRLAELAKGELLVFCDANSQIGPDVLRGMTGHFADERVGCVTGTEITVRDEHETALITGNTAFLDYEGLVNRWESRLGSVLVCDGALFSIRRSLFQPLQADLANDLELPLYIGAEGYAVLFEPVARAFEKTAKSAQEEFNRRRRICGQGILGMWRLRRCLRGMRGWQFASRKVLRWFALVPMMGLLLSSALLASEPVFAAIFAVQVCCYVLALVGAVTALTKRGAHRVFALPFFLALSNVGALVGVVQAMAGRRFAVWQPITRAHQTAHSARHS